MEVLKENRAIDLFVTYRFLKLLVTPFDKQDAFKFGIIDIDGKVLRKARSLRLGKEKRAYTLLHRLVFNFKRILKYQHVRSPPCPRKPFEKGLRIFERFVE